MRTTVELTTALPFISCGNACCAPHPKGPYMLPVGTRGMVITHEYQTDYERKRIRYHERKGEPWRLVEIQGIRRFISKHHLRISR